MTPCHLHRGILFLTLALVWQSSLAQHADEKVSHSLYNRIRLVDERTDTLGGTPTGIFQDYFNGLIGDLTDSTAGSGELVLQLRSFSVHEVHTSFTRTRINWIRILLYVPAEAGGRQYTLLASLDTVIEMRQGGPFKSSLHKRLSVVADDVLASFIGGNLNRRATADDPTIDLANIRDIDLVVKRRLPLYISDTLREGVYRSWRSWSLQEPDGDISSYNPLTTYILVKGGKAYFFLSSGYVPLVKRDNDYYYIGKVAQYSATTSEMASLASLAASVAGLGGIRYFAVWNIWRKKDFWMRMDPVSGHFDAEREVRKGEE